jgi:LPS-assembly protein
LAAGFAFAQPAFQRTPVPRPNQIPPGDVEIRSATQLKEGAVYRLRGKAQLETSDLLLRADEIDYNEDTGEAEARGDVYLKHFAEGEELWADRVEYNVTDESGKFFNVRGSAPVQFERRPGILSSDNPYYFEGRWAERLEDRYILYDGFLTNCKMPNPWWVLRGPKFDVIPGQRALAYRSVFRLRGIPLFYAPVFYKSLEKRPRKSGFLTPNLGNSSRRGKMVGAGYYWAINRSYDATYRGQYFTQRGLAHNVDVRGKPRAGTEFNGLLYGVNDRGVRLQDAEVRSRMQQIIADPNQTPENKEAARQVLAPRKEGGFLVSFEGHSDLGNGFRARGEVNYLSSLKFRQAFTESFNEAIFSEVHSTGFVTRDWSTFGLNVVFQRQENFQSIRPDDTIVIRKLPVLEFSSRDRQIWSRGLPVWVSVDSSAGLLRRKQPLFQTRQFLERTDIEPRIMTAIRWKGFNVLPSFSLRETHWGESREDGRIIGRNINRHSREFAVALEPPSLARIFQGPGWLGQQVKHVIEPSASFRYVSGVNAFDRYIRFDETELLANTTQAEVSLVNRIYTKKNGVVNEFLSWQLSQQRYFDPGFGGAIVEGRRNVLLPSIQLTPYAFLDRPRNYSPVISLFRLNPMPGFGVEWRTDYDPLRGKVVNSGLSADGRYSKYFVSVGHNSVRSLSYLSPNANQFRGRFGIGDENRRGWNAGFDAIYDFRTGQMQFATTQVTYNTDCCGWSIQYRRFSFGTRNENQFRVAFAVANIGSFGTLKKQERIF